MNFETKDITQPTDMTESGRTEFSLGDLFGGLLDEVMETLVEQVKAFAEEHELEDLLELVTSDEAIALMTAAGLVEVVAVIKLYKVLEQKGEVSANENTFNPEKDEHPVVKHFDFTPSSNMSFGGVELLAGEKTNIMLKAGGESELKNMLTEVSSIITTAKDFDGQSFLVVPDSFRDITPKAQAEIQQVLADEGTVLVISTSR